MQYIVCAVRDSKSDVFGRPFIMGQIGQAIRSFDDEVNRAAEENTMFHHPEDFALYQIGHYDDQDGRLVPLDVPKLLVQADQVKKGQLHISAV